MEVPVHLEDHVGIQKQQPGGVLFVGQLHELGAVVAKVHERAVLESTGKVAEDGLEPIACVVVRSGVDDHPGVDVGDGRPQAALDHRRLVLDDHGETDRGAIAVGHDGLG